MFGWVGNLRDDAVDRPVARLVHVNRLLSLDRLGREAVGVAGGIHLRYDI